MRPESSSCGECRRPARYVWLCVLLTALFLYNPFVVAPSSGLGLNLHHSASHRATVGASELQQFRATERHAPAIRMAVVVRELVFVQAVAFARFAVPDVEAHTPLNILPSSLWFRPPPSL